MPRKFPKTALNIAAAALPLADCVNVTHILIVQGRTDNAIIPSSMMMMMIKFVYVDSDDNHDDSTLPLIDWLLTK